MAFLAGLCCCCCAEGKTEINACVSDALTMCSFSTYLRIVLRFTLLMKRPPTRQLIPWAPDDSAKRELIG